MYIMTIPKRNLKLGIMTLVQAGLSMANTLQLHLISILNIKAMSKMIPKENFHQSANDGDGGLLNFVKLD